MTAKSVPSAQVGAFDALAVIERVWERWPAGVIAINRWRGEVVVCVERSRCTVTMNRPEGRGPTITAALLNLGAELDVARQSEGGGDRSVDGTGCDTTGGR